MSVCVFVYDFVPFPCNFFNKASHWPSDCGRINQAAACWQDQPGSSPLATTVWLQQTVRSSCWSSMFNGIWPEPTNKPFNSAYLQIKYLILRKIHSNTIWLDKTLSCRSQVTMMFQKKRFFENKKSEWDFQLGTSLPSPPSKKNKLLLKNHWGYTLVEVRLRPRNGCINKNKQKNKKNQNSWSGQQAYLGTNRRQKSPLDGATDFLATIWQHIKTVSFL